VSITISSAVTRVTLPPRRDHGRRIGCDLLFESRARQRGVGEQKRNCLPLHIRAHQGPVGVVVFEERDERRRDRHELIRRHIHEIDLVWRQQRVVIPPPTQHEVLDEAAVRIETRVRLGDRVVLLLGGRQPFDLVRDESVHDFSVRGLQEPELIEPGKRRHRRDETDVRSLRRLDRTHPAVVRVVDVPNLEARTFAA
jgi:hypothetical protein